MSPTTPSDRCEALSREISSFLDGELSFPESLPAVDHIATCEACRDFYLGARRLSEKLVATPAPPAPDAIWDRIAGPAAAPVRGRRRFSPRAARAVGLAAAAVLVVALGVARLRTPPAQPGASPAGAPSALREIVVEGARGKMTDERFVSLLAELLSADGKYHRETERVLRFVLRREGSGELEEPATAPTEDVEATDSESGDGEAGPRKVRAAIPLAS